MVRLLGDAEWSAPVEEERVDLPEPDYDPGPTVSGPSAPDALGGYVAELEELLGQLMDLVEWVPWHAYCEWRATGASIHADKVDDWQIRRDAAFSRARKLLAEAES